MSIDLDRQIGCVEKEIALRRNVYKRNVELGKMAQASADRQIQEMEAVLETLLRVQAYTPIMVPPGPEAEAVIARIFKDSDEPQSR